ncbi:DUF4238 domain-containing protein [Dactylosporangium sp. CA-233914]|uniref:DUF4238 domain-containing protein n=1 Tax=Dactylosporangium sp. CA-233914 TaxID=3239934 RepID=UPI003D9150C8
MSSQVSRDHHTVPKLYLKGFCGTRGADKGIVLARYRDGGEKRLTIKEATVEPDFYDTGDGSTPDDSLERWFDRAVENPVGELMGAIRNGTLPTVESDREAVARFVAAQMVRTIAFRTRMADMSSHLGPLLFSMDVLHRAIAEDPSLTQDEAALTSLQRQIAERAPDEVRHPDRQAAMRNMVREGDRLKPLLLSMRWLLTYSDRPVLVTGDTPVTAVSGTGEVSFLPMLLPEQHEVQIPVTPHRLLTMTPFPALGASSNLSREQAILVNESIVRGCSAMVLRRPDMAWPSDLVLPSVRASLAPPRVTVSAGAGGAPTVPVWPVVVERAFKEALELLGGDPDVA